MPADDAQHDGGDKDIDELRKNSFQAAGDHDRGLPADEHERDGADQIQKHDEGEGGDAQWADGDG